MTREFNTLRPAENWTRKSSMAVTKIVHRILPLRVASVNRNGLELKYRISVALRLCSSTSISCKPNKSLNSDNEIGYTDSQVHRSNIRWICKSGGKQQLFDEFLKLPNEGLSDSLNCALYWYSYYDKIEEAFELKNLMERRGISKSYSTYSILAYLFAKAGQLGSRKAFFDEMISNGLTPQARHYVPFLEAEVEKGDLVSAFEVFYEMQQSTQKHTGHSSCYRKLIRACAGREDESTTGKVLQLFDDLRKRPHFLSVEILEAVKLWFDSQENNNWVTTWSKASSSYHCQSCQYQLAEGQFTASELEQLKVHVLSHLWKTHKAVAEVKCYTSCGNFIDHMKMGRDGTFPHSIHQFLKASGPYDIVVDGLNVGYFGGGFDPGKVKIVVSHFLKENKKVLVVCSKPMSLDVRKKRGRQTQLGKLMNFLTDHCGVFCLPNRSLDDLYFLSAAMHCGPETRLVSCDRFVDHLQGLDAVTALQFKRWSRLNQLHLLKFENETPIFKDLPPFDATVQTTGDTWHFPSRNGDLWLCARKAQQWQHVEKEDSK